MCTAVLYQNRYFGRNLDHDRSFGESVVIAPRNFPFFKGCFMKHHFAIIGMAHVSENYPLYYDAMNEKGLAMAGLLFAGNAVYGRPAEGKDNIPSWAFIPWILGQCKSVDEAEKLLQRLNLTEEPFSKELPPSPLHWMIADKKRSVVVESMVDGLHIHENPVDVLTNDPPFPFHLQNLHQYLNLTAEEPNNRFSERIKLQPFSRGMGAIGLPGDWSSVSRFVRAAFVKANSTSEGKEDLHQFFHILGSVEQPKGCNRLKEGGSEQTLYTSCCDLERGVYYYKTYDNFHITAAELFLSDISGAQLQQIPLQKNDVF